jgi:hypothetical protein
VSAWRLSKASRPASATATRGPMSGRMTEVICAKPPAPSKRRDVSF